MQATSSVTTFLFTDIEGSTRLWELEPERMRPALARHDAIARAAVERNRGEVVKMSGDGLHAAFADPADGVRAAFEMQLEIAGGREDVTALAIRCGLHAGVSERRDRDFFGGAVNRAARIMSVAHGGQILVSEAVAALVAERLPTDASLRDLGSVRLRDLSHPERIYQLEHPALRKDFPPLRSLESIANNLPQQMTSFIGRERELSELKALLGKTRLLTLVGPGGIGKTRLSLQIAAEAMLHYPDGVWLVELAALTDPRVVAHAVASVLGVKEEAGRPMAEALARYAKDRRLLLVLDNCEHLLAACAALAKKLLHAAPAITILASSREHLRIAGETIYSVPALTTPPRDKLIAGALADYEAARLFVERALAVQPDFQVSERNAVAVAEVCHRLDGIPLAIELAASRVRAVPIETIVARLNDRFRLLSRGDRTALPRQQTLRALIDWSYDLLTAEERAVLRRLSVCAGGWTLEAAEAIAPSDGLASADVLDLLGRLAEKSLVAVDTEGGRYRLLDTVREYALERLNASQESDAAHGRHLAYFLSFAEKARPELAGRDQRLWFARLDLEHENILAAHAWCDRDPNGAQLGLRLVESMRAYWFNRGLLTLRHRLTIEALQRPGAQKRDLARCLGLFNAGQACCFMGRYGDARGYLEESLSIARELASRERIEPVLQLLGMVAFGQGELESARAYLGEALGLAQSLGNRNEIASALNGLAQVHRAERNLDAAEPLYEQFLVLARELGARENVAIGLLNLAMVAIDRRSVDRARLRLVEALDIAEQTGFTPARQSVFEVSAGLACLLAEWRRAAKFFGVAEAQAEHTGLHRDPGDEAFLLPRITEARAALGDAAFASVEQEGRRMPFAEAIAEARAWLATAPG